MVTKMKEIVSKVYGDILKVKKSESILIICDKTNLVDLIKGMKQDQRRNDECEGK